MVRIAAASQSTCGFSMRASTGVLLGAGSFSMRASTFGLQTRSFSMRASTSGFPFSPLLAGPPLWPISHDTAVVICVCP